MSGPDLVSQKYEAAVRSAADALKFALTVEPRKLIVTTDKGRVCFEFHGDRMVVWIDGETEYSEYLPLSDQGPAHWTPHNATGVMVDLQTILRRTVPKA